MRDHLRWVIPDDVFDDFDKTRREWGRPGSYAIGQFSRMVEKHQIEKNSHLPAELPSRSPVRCKPIEPQPGASCYIFFAQANESEIVALYFLHLGLPGLPATAAIPLPSDGAWERALHRLRAGFAVRRN